MSRLLVIGHRGDPSRAPENTRSSFDAALEAGADIIETDVRLTADEHIVVSHDEDFSRLGGPDRAIRECRRDEIESFVLEIADGRAERPLFMDDALQSYPDTGFNVDLKDSGWPLVRAWADLLNRSGAAHRCRTASFFDRTLHRFSRIEGEQPVSVARIGIAWLLLLSVFGISRRPKSREGVMQIPEKAGRLRIVSPRTIAIWHRYGWKIEVWTIDNEEDMKRLICWGVDGIITNRPSLLTALLNRRYSGENS